VTVHRPPLADSGAFRDHVRAACSDAEGPVLIANYSRSAVGQSGTGHFSPIGGYSAATDRVLVLDTARFKYPPHWLPLESLFAAMEEHDPDNRSPRGWLTLERASLRSEG
jgi:glutathione gamma-glutamylcysteinyltransferase